MKFDVIIGRQESFSNNTKRLTQNWLKSKRWATCTIWNIIYPGLTCVSASLLAAPMIAAWIRLCLRYSLHCRHEGSNFHEKSRGYVINFSCWQNCKCSWHYDVKTLPHVSHYWLTRTAQLNHNWTIFSLLPLKLQ